MSLIDEDVVRMQRINLTYWYKNCKCDCKSCYEMRKAIKRWEEE